MATDEITSKLDCFVTLFRFTVNANALESTNCVESSNVVLRDVSWKVKLCKRPTKDIDTTKATNVVDIFLISALDDGSGKWSCEAQAVFTLLQKEGQNDKTIRNVLQKQQFGDANLSFGIENFVDWDKFLAEYVNDNKAFLDVEISTNPLQRIVPSKMVQLYTRLHMFVENVSKLDEIFSSEVIVQGIKWKIHIEKIADNLAVYLLASDITDMSWSYSGDIKIELLSYDGRPLAQRLGHDFSWATPEAGFDKFLSWSEFIDSKNKYVVNDKANFIVEFKVDEPKPSRGIIDPSEPKPEPESESPTGLTLDCAICMESFGSGDIWSTKCGHLYCGTCLDQTLKHALECPLCKKPCYRHEIHKIYFPE